jgi:hypothetical protein
MLAEMDKACVKYGGPQGYLNALYSTTAQREEFSRKLYEVFPPDATATYNYGKDLQ